jgi:hypothetical protein
LHKGDGIKLTVVRAPTCANQVISETRLEIEHFLAAQHSPRVHRALALPDDHRFAILILSLCKTQHERTLLPQFNIHIKFGCQGGVEVGT